MRTTEIEIGTITEWLEENEEVANTIIEKHCYINVDYNDWYDYILEDFCDESSKIGFDIETDEIQFSGFYSQGDGASFEGTINILTYLTKTKQMTAYRSLVRAINYGYISDTVSIYRGNSNYSHEYTCYTGDIEEYEEVTSKVYDLMCALQDELEKKRLELCSDLYRNLEQHNDYLCSREQIIETMEVNEYEFTSDGEIV